ncbi:MAG: ATP cone domain-containing protein [Nanoarchaeota archaeon]
MRHIVKRAGHKEHFDERKVYASCYAACLSAHIKHRQAEEICDKVTRDVKKWIMTKEEVTSHRIFRKVASCLRVYDKDAAFMYETHRDIG